MQHMFSDTVEGRVLGKRDSKATVVENWLIFFPVANEWPVVELTSGGSVQNRLPGSPRVSGLAHSFSCLHGCLSGSSEDLNGKEL